ncbi:S28 family serine protease [Streptomyces sp. NPDC001922]|uniref:S28 family serine protease n=1 Tax=Streptomyces sp. NPDC001922 TaxID=3364624 RepID=UPI0036A45DF9
MRNTRHGSRTTGPGTPPRATEHQPPRRTSPGQDVADHHASQRHPPALRHVPPALRHAAAGRHGTARDLLAEDPATGTPRFAGTSHRSAPRRRPHLPVPARRLLTFSLLAGLLLSGTAGPAQAGTPSAPSKPRPTVTPAEAPRPAASPTATPAAAPAPTDIRSRIEALPGMRVIAERPAATGHRFFELGYRQPVDHRHPGKGTFEQRLTLLHKSLRRPTVLYTTGYEAGSDPAFRAEPTRLVDGNQISTEHRYFGTSRPDRPDWSKLDIRQAADDHHRIIRALKTLYSGAWLTTGGSKGGMATVYHRRFHPRDVDGTVVYGAPNNTDDRDDTAYDRFLGRVGTPACRSALRAVQREALVRREEMAGRYAQWARQEGQTFRTLGSADRAYELAVLRLPLMFWMYSGADGCASVPAPTATTDELYRWVDGVSRFPVYTDRSLASVLPYFHQLGTQLGYAQFDTSHLAGLLRHPGIQQVRSYVPRDIPLRFQPDAMPDIDRWVRRHGRELLFVYGENDTARAEPFRLGSGSRDSAVRLAPGANHRARIADLAPADAADATATVRRWAGQH